MRIAKHLPALSAGAVIGVLVAGCGLWIWVRVSEEVISRRLDSARQLAGAQASLPRVVPQPLAVPRSIPLGWRVNGPDQDGFEAASLVGQVVFLHVWATWCAPCVVELPSIARLSARNNSVAFVLVSLDGARPARALLERRGIPLPAQEAAGDLPSELRDTAVPRTFILNKKGQIVLAHYGAGDWATEEVEDLLRSLVEQ